MYYDDLSGDSSNESTDSEGDEDICQGALLAGRRIDGPKLRTVNEQDPSAPSVNLDESKRTRIILHMDVDCFYCQCEMQDRGIPVDRPFAVGQKHIIVTCNYAARRFGVGKLESRDTAKKKCPGLLILEGSDLERYRKHARRIYESFRQACKRIHPDVSVCKGSMDEATADLTIAVRSRTSSTNTGDPERARFDASRSRECISSDLQSAAQMALQIRRTVLEETGFTTTLGVSVNPLLAKIGSGLKKPTGTPNILYPWDSTRLLQPMPLRKIPGLGSRTVQALVPALARHGRETVLSDERRKWTCGYVNQGPVGEP